MANDLNTNTSDYAALEVAIRRVEAFEEFIARGGRNDAIKCRDYFDDRQWTPAEMQALLDAGQPVVVDNRIKPKIMFILGVEATQRSDPKAFPREPGDEAGADLGSKILRYVGDAVEDDRRFSEGFEYLNIEGIEAHIVLADGDGNVVHSDIPYHRYIYDPHSSDRYFEDKKYDGIIAWMDKDDILTLWPNAEKDGLLAEEGFISDTFLEDRPNDHEWHDSERDRYRVIQLFWRERGTWMEGIFTKSGWFEKPQVSRWLDQDGNPENPIVSASAFIDRFNDRYSIIRQMLSPQDEINKRRSKALHWADSRQIGVEGNATRQEIEILREEAHKADGVLHLRNENASMTVLDNPAITATQLEFMNLAIQAIDASGPNPSLQGKDERLRSGRAIRANQSGGILELNRVFDTHQWVKKKVYEKYWQRVRQSWSDQKVFRITDSQNKNQFVTVNEPTTVEEAIRRRYNGTVPTAIESSVEFQLRRHEQVTLNNVGKINADITIEPVPDTVNMQEELFQILSNALQYMPPDKAAIAADIMLENLPLPNKAELLNRIQGKSEDPEVQKAQAEAQEKAATAEELQMRLLQAEVEETEASADLKGAQAIYNAAKARQTQIQPEGARA